MTALGIWFESSRKLHAASIDLPTGESTHGGTYKYIYILNSCNFPEDVARLDASRRVRQSLRMLFT